MVHPTFTGLRRTLASAGKAVLRKKRVGQGDPWFGSETSRRVGRSGRVPTVDMPDIVIVV
jgi:hypothetical protein